MIVLSKALSALISRRAVLLLSVVILSCDSGVTPPRTLGSVSVTVTTTGDDVDADGYTVNLGSGDVAAAVSGTTTIDGLEPGTYSVTLGGVAANCSVEGGVARSVTVSDGVDASVSFDVACLFDAAGETLAEIACPALAPQILEGIPLDVVSLGSAPSGLERPLWARVSWDGGPLVSQGLVQDAGAQSAVMIPLHPSASAEGGDVTIRISDEVQTCPPFTFRILPLPAASDELTALADVIQDLLDQHSVLFGTTREALRGTPIPNLEPALVPLSVAYAIVDGAGGESLRSYADGSAADLTSEDFDLLERLVARTGLRADLEAELAEVLAEGAAPSAAGGPRHSSPARAFSPGVALECVTLPMLDAAALDECMTLARDKVQGAASEATQGKAMLAMDVAALLGGRSVAKPISSLLTVSKLYDQAVAGILPSSFLSIDVSANPTEFLEDEAGPGTWVPAEVMASSTGWNFEALTAELIAGRISPGSGLPFQVPRLSWRQKKGLEALSEDVALALWNAVDIENFFLGLREELVKQLVQLGVQEFADGALAVAPRTYGPVDISDTEWSDARVVTGTSVVLTPHEQYEPREPGISLLEVITAQGKFGGTNIATDPFPQVRVGSIDLDFLYLLEPVNDVFVSAGDTVRLDLAVANSAFPDTVELLDLGPLQGTAALTLRGGEPLSERVTHRVTYIAPDDLTELPALLTARHTATTGARQYGGELSATVTIRANGVQITTIPTCMERGSTLQMEAVGGEGDGAGLVWSTTSGSISSSGLFTAPDDAQVVTVTVALADSPELTDSVQVQVGGCSCQVSVTVDGIDAGDTRIARFFLSNDASAVVGIDWAGGVVGPDQSSAGLTTFGGDVLNPQAIPFGTTGTYSVRAGGLIAFTAWRNPEDPDNPVGPLVSMTIEENDGGDLLAGSASGQVALFDSAEPRMVPFTMVFRIEADPNLGDATTRVCQVDG